MKQTCVGIDLVEVGRIRDAIDRWGERFLHRVYTAAELERHRNDMESLAARFAGKEAVIKALSLPDGGYISWKDIEILSGAHGKPSVNLYGKASRLAQESGIKVLEISLSHTRENAIAVAIGIT